MFLHSQLFASFLILLSLLNPEGAGESASGVRQLIRKADALQEKGQNALARDLYQRALGSLRPGPPTPELGHVLSVLSDIQLSDGDYDASVELAQAAADVYRSLGDKHGEAVAHNQKGLAQVQRGSFADGEASLHTALELARSAQDAELEVQVLNSLGSPFYLQGKYSEALRAYDQALEILNLSPDAKWSLYWRQITDFNQATLYQRLGRYQRALEIYRRVQAHPAGFSPGDRAHVLANVGTLHRRLGDPGKALENYRAAQALYGGAHDADGEISVLKNTGIVQALDKRDYAAATKIFRTVQSLADGTKNRRETMQAHLYLGEAFFRAGSSQPAATEFATALSLSQQLGTTEEQWKAAYGLGRIAEASGQSPLAENRYRDAIQIIEQARSQLQQTSLRAEFLADKRDVYDSLIGILLKRNEVASAFDFLERSRARTFQDRVSGSEKPAAGFVSLDEARSRLGPNDLLLEFWASGDRVALFWCRKDGFGVLDRTFASQKQAQLHEAIDQISSDRLADWKGSLGDLAELLPNQDAAAWRGAKQILIVPDGWLSIVPFELVPFAGQQLIQRVAITYLPSAILLRRPHSLNPTFRGPWSTELIAFGDPLVRNDTFSSSMDANPGTLPGSIQEVKDIAQMVPGKSRTFLGADNLKTAFLSQANNAPLLHISTHAFADVTNPEDSRILFSSSRADRTADYVFLRELNYMTLDRVRLATISACDTERGAIIRGEGVQAFSRSLLSAGVRASVTSLWRVDDAATAEFMKQFYFFALVKREPLAEALRDAKITFINSPAWQHPHFWAAFVLNGDGDERVPATLSWVQLISAGVAFPALLFAVAGVFILRRRHRIDRQHHAGRIVTH